MWWQMLFLRSEVKRWKQNWFYETRHRIYWLLAVPKGKRSQKLCVLCRPRFYRQVLQTLQILHKMTSKTITYGIRRISMIFYCKNIANATEMPISMMISMRKNTKTHTEKPRGECFCVCRTHLQDACEVAKPVHVYQVSRNRPGKKDNKRKETCAKTLAAVYGGVLINKLVLLEVFYMIQSYLGCKAVIWSKWASPSSRERREYVLSHHTNVLAVAE